eukprot:766974-Hanusia_phi.AAC.1
MPHRAAEPGWPRVPGYGHRRHRAGRRRGCPGPVIMGRAAFADLGLSIAVSFCSSSLVAETAHGSSHLGPYLSSLLSPNYLSGP